MLHKGNALYFVFPRNSGELQISLDNEPGVYLRDTSLKSTLPCASFSGLKYFQLQVELGHWHIICKTK